MYLGINILVTIETIERECYLEFPNIQRGMKRAQDSQETSAYPVCDKPWMIQNSRKEGNIHMSLFSKFCLNLLISMFSSSSSQEFLLPIMSLTQQLLIPYHCPLCISLHQAVPPEVWALSHVLDFHRFLSVQNTGYLLCYFCLYKPPFSHIQKCPTFWHCHISLSTMFPIEKHTTPLPHQIKIQRVTTRQNSCLFLATLLCSNLHGLVLTFVRH